MLHDVRLVALSSSPIPRPLGSASETGEEKRELRPFGGAFRAVGACFSG
jgi:hypothetical protein